MVASLHLLRHFLEVASFALVKARVHFLFVLALEKVVGPVSVVEIGFVRVSRGDVRQLVHLEFLGLQSLDTD